MDLDNETFVPLQRPQTQMPHAYFDALAARPDRIKAYPLRSQAELDQRVKSPPSKFFKYIWPNDDYARPQDAAKLVKPPRNQFSTWFPGNPWGNSGDENIAGGQTLRLPIGVSSGTILVTWDTYWGEEFQTNAGWANNPVNGWKTFFLFTGEGIGGGEAHWLGHDVTSMANPMMGEVAKHHDGPVGRLRSWTTAAREAAQISSSDPRKPTGQGALPARSFATHYNRWTRYWLEVRMDVPGSEFTEWSQEYLGGATLSPHPDPDTTWDMISLWIADEQREPVRVLFRVPAPRLKNEMISSLRLAWDTSTNNLRGGGLIGPVIAYVRNLVVLRQD